MAYRHLGLARLYYGTGDHPRAEEHLATATTMCHDMDMSLWLARAETALSEVA